MILTNRRDRHTACLEMMVMMMISGAFNRQVNKIQQRNREIGDARQPREDTRRRRRLRGERRDYSNAISLKATSP